MKKVYNDIFETSLNFRQGGPRGRAVKRLSHRCVCCGFESRIRSCETSQCLLAGVKGVYLGVLPFSPIY